MAKPWLRDYRVWVLVALTFAVSGLELAFPAIFVSTYYVIIVVFSATLGRPRITAALCVLSAALALQFDLIAGNWDMSAIRRMVVLFCAGVASVIVAGMLRRERQRWESSGRTADEARQSSEGLYRLLAENAADVVFRMDREGRFLWLSPSVADVLGWAQQDLPGKHMLELVHPDHLERVVAARVGMLGVDLPGLTFPLRRRDGSYIWMSARFRPVTDDESGDFLGSVGGLRDVDVEVKSQQSLARSEARFRAVMESAPAGMAVLGLDRKFIEVNPSLCRILQVDEQSLLGHSITGLLDDDGAAMDAAKRLEVITGPVPSSAWEHMMRRPDGSQVWVEHSIALLRDSQGAPESYVSLFIDVTAARTARERLRFMATHDSLTELINRGELRRRIDEVLGQRTWAREELAILFIDLDGLKSINDTHGHATGDRVIAEVADRLRATVRSGDLVARLGGDEFVVALLGLSHPQDARTVAEKIHLLVARPVVTGTATTVPVALSIGVAFAEADDDTDDVLARADGALYRAKRSGGGRTVFQDPEIDVSGPRDRRRP